MTIMVSIMRKWILRFRYRGGKSTTKMGLACILVFLLKTSKPDKHLAGGETSSRIMVIFFSVIYFFGIVRLRTIWNEFVL